MTVVVDTPEGKVAICKGALSSVLTNCKTIYEDGEVKLLTSAHKDRLNEICCEMGEDALGVLTFSYKKLDGYTDKNVENNHVFLGMIGMEDPPREDVKKSIQKCHKAGIKVVMITGDNKNTAMAIGRELGLFTNGVVLSGSELENMSDRELDSIIEKVQVFARTSPEQKLRIKYLLSGSLGEMIAIFLASAVTGNLPLLFIQILWVNVICETILGSPLAVEVPSEDVMNNPPLENEAPIIDKKLGKQVLKRGLGIGLSTFAAFQIPFVLGMGIAKARTLAFTNLVFTQIVNCYDSRSIRSKRSRSSKYMLATLLASAALFIGILYIPFMRALLGTVPLNIMDWLLVSGLTTLSRI